MLLETQNFAKKSKFGHDFWSKVEISVKNRSFVQNSKFCQQIGRNVGILNIFG